MANILGGKRRVGERTISTRGRSVQEFVPSAAWTDDSLSHCLLVDLPDFKKEEVKLEVDKSGVITVSGERLVNPNKSINFKKSFKVPENSDTSKITGKFDGEILYVTVPKKAQVEKKDSPKNEIEESSGVAKGKEAIVAKDNVQEKEKFIAKGNVEEKEKTVAKDIIQEKEKIVAKDIVQEKGEAVAKYNVEEKEKISSSIDEDKDKLEKKERKVRYSCVDGFDRKKIEKWGGENKMLERAIIMVKKNKDILITAALAFSLGVLFSRKFQAAP